MPNPTSKFGSKGECTPILSVLEVFLTMYRELRSWPFLRLFRLKWPTSELSVCERNASRMLKIGVHSPFDPNFDLGGGTFYPQKFRQA